MIVDNLFIELMHGLYVAAGGFFTPFFRMIMLLGEKAWPCLLISCLLCLRKRTRWIGVTAIIAIFLGFVGADLILKPLVHRARPYVSSSNVIYQYWVQVGSLMEKDAETTSFPSGHVVGLTAFVFSVFICIRKRGRKRVFTFGMIAIILMACSRMYFMHHYFTDCLGGFVLGVIVAFIGKQIAKLIHLLCVRYENVPIFNFILNFNFLSGDTNNQ